MRRLLIGWGFGLTILLCTGCGPGTATADSEPSVAEPPVDSTLLIVPGRRLGGLTVLARMESVNEILGPPVFSDSGAGTTVARYRVATGKDSADLLAILTFEPTDDMHKDLQVVRTNSAAYRDARGLGVGSSRDALAAHYSLTGPLATFTDRGDSLHVYDAGNGLTVEFDGSDTCRGLAVHSLDRYPTANYRADYPEMAVTDTIRR